jgi:hypothetical protein
MVDGLSVKILFKISLKNRQMDENTNDCNDKENAEL